MVAGYKGVQGRKPIPTNLKILHGNPGKRPLNKDEPTPRALGRIPSPPAQLSELAQDQFRRLARQLLDLGLLAKVDVIALATLAASYARWLEAQQMLKDTGLLIVKKDGEVRLTPLLRLSIEAQAEVVRLLAEFGLSPSSRSRLHVEKPPAQDDFEREFG